MKSTKIFAFLLLSLTVCFCYLAVEVGQAQVSFTFTSSDTEETAVIGDTVEFGATLTNTGDSADNYDVNKIEKPPTPVDWNVQLCTGEFCFDESVNHVEVPLESSESEQIGLKITTSSDGPGKVTIRITSQTNPSLTDSITFILSRPSCGDVIGDGNVNLSDVIRLAKFYFGTGDPPGSNWASDVNCDSKKDLTDVILIAKFFFGQPVTLDCCP